MGLIHFTVPGQPYGKGRPRVGKVGAHVRMFTPAKTASYENLVKHAAFEAMAVGQLRLPLFECPVRVVIHLACQVPASWSKKKQTQALEHAIRPTTKPDMDNVVKAIFDAMNGVVWKDDVQVCRLDGAKFYDESPCVRVWVDAL